MRIFPLKCSNQAYCVTCENPGTRSRRINRMGQVHGKTLYCRLERPLVSPWLSSQDCTSLHDQLPVYRPSDMR